ncbi:MAG: single-stranded DNA-binding protein [Bacteroidales bacterium]
MAGVNKVILLGNLGKDPDVMTLESGVKVVRFPLATNEYYKGKDGEPVEKTEWHRVVLWRNRAELAEKYLSKGRQVYIEGRLQTRQWEDKEGNKRYTTEVVGDVINFIGGKPGQGGEDTSRSGGEQTDDQVPGSPPEEDDLPF